MWPHRLIKGVLALPMVLACAGSAVMAASPESAGIEFFEKRIRPVLVENCFGCHSGNKKKGNLQLDTRSRIMKGGDTGPAIIPGQPEASLLIKAIRYSDEALKMPPKNKLAPETINDLAAWVRMKAPWPQESQTITTKVATTAFDLKERARHWSLQPLRVHLPPIVHEKKWVKTPIDSFVLAKLEAANLAPAPAADKRTLLRRVTYDLVGLPPGRGEIQAFLSDQSPDAYMKVVDRLLASPQYGERWGRHWLDLVRFAETAGHEFDFEIPEAYRYRDYVIRAFNADVPYDQFVVEHIAGDLIPRPRQHPATSSNESILGTGFWFLGETKHSPVDVKADEADRIDNQIDVWSKAFLGLTVACARCHDHKFDAISTRDYYAMAGYLESSRYQRAFVDASGPRQEIARQLKALHAAQRAIAVEESAALLHDQMAHFADYLLGARDVPHAGTPASSHGRYLVATELGDWVQALSKSGLERFDHPLHPWYVLASDATLGPDQFAHKRRQLIESMGAQSRKQVDSMGRVIVFEDFKKPTYSDWSTTGEAFGDGPTQGLDVILHHDPKNPVRQVVGPGVASSGLNSSHLRGVLRSKTFIIRKKHIWYHVAGTNSQINLIIDGFQQIRNPIYGGLSITLPANLRKGHHYQWLEQDVSLWTGQRAYIEMIDDGPGHLAVDQILFSDEGPPPGSPNELLVRMLDDPQLDCAEKLASKYQDLLRDTVAKWRQGTLTEGNDCTARVALLNWMLTSKLFALGHKQPSGPHDAPWQQLKTLADREAHLEASLPPPLHGMAMTDGTPWNEHVFVRGNSKRLGEEVPRRFLEVLEGDHQSPPAQGSGRLELAKQMVAGSDPLVPRVIVNRLWQHHFGKGIVRSPDNFGVLGEVPTHPELLDYLAGELVRQNWSLKQMHRVMLRSNTYQMASHRREDVEARDPQNKLFHRMPIRRLEAESIRDAIMAVSGRLDQRMFGTGVHPFLTPHMAGRGRPESGPLDGEGRRSIYINVRRNFLTPMFLAFDYPIPFTTNGRRNISNVPAQALALMNNPFVIEQTRLWAQRVLEVPDLNREQRIALMYETAFGRPPESAEVAAAINYLEKQISQHGQPYRKRAWADLGHVLLNVKEFIFVN